MRYDRLNMIKSFLIGILYPEHVQVFGHTVTMIPWVTYGLLPNGDLFNSSFLPQRKFSKMAQNYSNLLMYWLRVNDDIYATVLLPCGMS